MPFSISAWSACQLVVVLCFFVRSEAADCEADCSNATVLPTTVDPFNLSSGNVELTIRTSKTNITLNGTHLAGQVPKHCKYPCRCDSSRLPLCPAGVTVIRDGCKCCPICARQQGDRCDSIQLCDFKRQLHCVYSSRNASAGICKVLQGLSCEVDGVQHKDGASFKLDCRTQCTCQNGTYGCVSLCPHENVRPSQECRNARLVKLHGNCCREWLCESDRWKPRVVPCTRRATEWSPCSATCGVGVSRRSSNYNEDCEMRLESRLCMLRPCASEEATPRPRHRTRRNHLCRATVKASCPMYFSDEHNCTTVRPYQPKFCGSCHGKRCCTPSLSTTVRLQFRCPDDDGEYSTKMKDVMSIVRCRCNNNC